MNVEKIISKVDKKVEELKKEKKEVKVKSLTRKHFKKELSVSNGFGFQDMKKKPRKLFQELVNRGYDVHVQPVNVNNLEVDLVVKVK